MMLHQKSVLSVYGFESPVRVFSEDQCRMVMRHWQHVRDQKVPFWPKARAIYDRVIFDLASRPLLVDRVVGHLGQDVILWGASLIIRKPGSRHSWHCDAESCGRDGFLSVWVGLDGISQESALNVIPGSHLFGKPIQQIMTEGGISRANLEDAAVLSMARSFRAEARILSPPMQVGDALFFDGRLWHGSNNTSDLTRSALLLQYARTDCVIRQPKQYAEWPFVFEETPPPVVVVSGAADQAPHDPVEPPKKGQFSTTPLETVVRNWSLPLEGDPISGWKAHNIALGSTPNLSSMSLHASVLNPGKSPHPPHAHVEEEILLILEGEAEILLGDGPDPEAATIHRLAQGAFAYYPAYQYHTIRNASAAPVTYLMFKWSGPPLETEGQAKNGFVLFPDSQAVCNSSDKGYQAHRFFQEPTAYLHRLHAHLTCLAPGSGYGKHSDAHDVAIVVLEGEVRSLGCTAGPGSVMYFPASQLHDMTNEGSAAASYLVFEFKGPEQIINKSLDCIAEANHSDAAPRRQRPFLSRAVNSAIAWIMSPLTRKIERVVDRRLRILLAEEQQGKE